MNKIKGLCLKLHCHTAFLFLSMLTTITENIVNNNNNSNQSVCLRGVAVPRNRHSRKISVRQICLSFTRAPVSNAQTTTPLKND